MSCKGDVRPGAPGTERLGSDGSSVERLGGDVRRVADQLCGSDRHVSYSELPRRRIGRQTRNFAGGAAAVRPRWSWAVRVSCRDRPIQRCLRGE